MVAYLQVCVLVYLRTHTWQVFFNVYFVRYSSGLEVDEKVTEQSIDTLKAVGLVPIDFAVQSLWSNSVVRLR